MTPFWQGFIVGGIVTITVQIITVILFVLTIHSDHCDDDDQNDSIELGPNDFPTRTNAGGTKRNNDTPN